MKQRSIARKYARVLMKVARDDSDLRKIEQELKSFSEILKASPEMQRFFTKPIVSKTKKLKLLHDLCQKASFLLSTQKILAVLAENDRLDMLEEIIDSLQQLRDEKNNIISIEVITASPLNSDMRERLIALFEKKLKKNIKICIKVDPSLIGGMITKVGSAIFDGSIRGQLLKIKEQIMRD